MIKNLATEPARTEYEISELIEQNPYECIYQNGVYIRISEGLLIMNEGEDIYVISNSSLRDDYWTSQRFVPLESATVQICKRKYEESQNNER